MRIKSFFPNTTIFEFILIAPQSSILILIGSILSGLLKSANVLALMPLMKYLGVTGNESNNILFVRYFEAMVNWLGLDNSIVIVLGFMVLVTWSILLTGFIIEIYAAKVSAKITRDFREEIIGAILNAKWLYFIKKETGSVIHAVITETGKTVSGYNDSIRFFSAVLQAVVLLLTTFLMSPYMSMLILFTGIIFFLVFSPFMAYAKEVGGRTGKLLKSITTRITNGLLGLKPLKAMNNERFLIPLLNHETIALEKQQIRSFMVSKLPPILREATVILIVALGAYYAVIYSMVPVVSLVPMIFLFKNAVAQLSSAQGVFQAQKGMEPFYISLKNSIAEAKRMEEEWKGTLDPRFDNSITINNMNFSYPTKNIFSNVSMVIPNNSFIALMGKSGGGKTTFSDILCGLHMPNSGQVLVDGRDLHELDIKKWRRMIGYVPQDLFLFHDSILNNVNIGDLTISKEDIVKALKGSGAWEFVSGLPDGVNTVIGERGIRLSGGQRQRISIARAIVRKPQLLILDEATTALDPKTEEKILKTIRKLTGEEITIVAVSHQKAVIDIADQVYELKNGQFKKVSSLYSN